MGDDGGTAGQHESGQQRVDKCATKATLSGDSTSTCENRRDAVSQQSLQQILDEFASLLLDTTRRAVLPHVTPASPQGLDLVQTRELVKSTFASEVQPGVARETAAKIDAAKEVVMKEVRELAVTVKTCKAKNEELENKIASMSISSSSSGGDGGGGGGGGGGASSDVRERVGALEAVWRESRQAQESQNAARGEKLDAHSVSIASLQSTLSQAEAARTVAEETLSALRERVSKLEVLVDLLVKKL